MYSRIGNRWNTPGWDPHLILQRPPDAPSNPIRDLEGFDMDLTIGSSQFRQVLSEDLPYCQAERKYQTKNFNKFILYAIKMPFFHWLISQVPEISGREGKHSRSRIVFEQSGK